jgi:hypothetical protein
VAAEGGRAGQPSGPGLARTLCVLFLAGVSCRYKVDLPGAVQDAAADAGGKKVPVDASVSFDLPLPVEKPAQTGDSCGGGQVFGQTQKVKLIFVLDRSASMQQRPFDGTQSRYWAAKQAILSAMRSHPNLEFGLDIFPQNPYQCMSGGNPSAIPDVQPSGNTQALIEGQLALCSPDGGCPAYANNSGANLALAKCYSFFSKDGYKQAQASKFVLLISDHDPNCAVDAGGDPCYQATQVASNLAFMEPGVQVFVISLSGEAGGCLRNIADSNASAFEAANSPAQFSTPATQSRLNDAVGGIVEFAERNLCRVLLMDQHGAANSNQLQVKIGDVVVPPDPSGKNGWNLDKYDVVVSEPWCSAAAANYTPPTVQSCQPTNGQP